MKSGPIIFTICLLLFLFFQKAQGQVFSVKCNDDRSRYMVLETLKRLNAKLARDTLEADYMVECHITAPQDFKAKHKGCIIIYDRMRTEIARTSEIKRNACAVNGFNAAADIFQVLAEDQLPALIDKIINQ